MNKGGQIVILMIRLKLFHKSVTEVSKTKLPKHVGPFGKCSLWDDYTSGHSAPAALGAGMHRAFIAEIIPRSLYSSKKLTCAVL